MASPPKISLKLLVDKKEQRALFAEAPKEFIDFLFHIFSVPIGTLIQVLGTEQMVGCLGKLKESIDDFHGTYLQPGVKKEDIFSPKTPFNGDTLLLSYDHASSIDESPASKSIYRCSSSDSYGYGSSNSACRSNATLYPNATCPNCNRLMNAKMTVVLPRDVQVPVKKEKGAGYVKEVVTYMVMDDLVVKPMSTISSITLINKCGIKDLSQLEEKTVSFGKEEVLKLLKASLSTDKVLTSVFLH